ncbi:MAG: hypothetical protein KF847_10125 [Pirellulales bacterium]|nr:hypothetical protein [Pirellulales bacterium]
MCVCPNNSSAKGWQWNLLKAGFVASIGFLSSAMGCSRTPTNRAEVAGVVTVDGNPAVGGAIALTPVDGQSPTVGGKIANGRFALIAPLGVAKVAIRVPKQAGERKLYDTPDSPSRPVMIESLPKKYNDETELTIDVKPGSNEQNFDLFTK